MIKVENLSYEFADRKLYNKVSFTLETGCHCAFIGTNGAGKSTLVDMIMSHDKYLYDGKIKIEDNTRIGYVSQFEKVDKDNTMTVFNYLSESFVKVQNEINRICAELETAEEFEELLEVYQSVMDLFNTMDGDNYEVNIKKELKVAGLENLENRRINELSGGEFKLIHVMKEMLVQPELLIMDEPDVFLDFENLNSLRQLINSHNGTVLVITHNRYLLNNCFNKILHLEDADIQEYDGNYTQYNFSLLGTKAELLEIAADEEAEIERNQKLVDKWRNEATAVASAAKGRKLKSRVSLLERLEARRVKPPFVAIRQPGIEFKLTEAVVSELEITKSELENVMPEDTIESEEAYITVKDYGVCFDEEILKNVNFEIGAHDKVAIVGPNGTGKTTMLREIFKTSENKEKECEYIRIKENIQIGYLSQVPGEMFDENMTVAQEFEKIGFDTKKEIYEYLSAYCFGEDILEKKIEKLSGGEKNLLQIAKIAATGNNLLLLDEPTSHLDTYSQIALEKAVKEYNGAVLMVSHDFYTIANCVDYVLLIENQTVRKMSVRKFRKMVYAEFFTKDYLELELKKDEAQQKVEKALEQKDFEKAEKYLEDMEQVVKQFK